MKLEVRLGARVETSRHDIEHLSRWTLASFEDLLRLVRIDLRRMSLNDWVSCRVHAVDRAGARLEFQSSGPDPAACVRNALRRSERGLRRHLVRKPGQARA